jgi:hypothetical protein
MSAVILIIQGVTLLVISYIAKWYLPSYFQEKGKNLAKKEDIAEITTKIEQVKHDYSSKLESIKTVLSTRLFIHQVRYQNEFNILLSLSEKLAKLRRALDNFEIQALRNEPNVANSAHTKEEALKTFAAMAALRDEYEANQPFYPEEIYMSVQKLHSLSWNTLVLTGHEKNIIEKTELSKIMIDMIKEKKQGSGAEETSEVIEDIYAAIRKRVQYWENLHIE